MFDGFMQLGGKEIANVARTQAYVQALAPAMPLKPCGDCGDLVTAVGDGPYTTPAGDDAPWYDPFQPESGEFLGFYPMEVNGMENSSRQAAITESTTDGGTVGQVRYGTKSIRYRGVLAATSELGLVYGMAWLRAALAANYCTNHTASCGGADLCFYAACPVGEDEEDFVRYERYMHDVTAVDGPTVVQEMNVSCGFMREVEFTLVAGVPYVFASTINFIPETPFSTFTTQEWRDVECIDGTPNPIIDPDCPPLPAPPRPPEIANPCIDPNTALNPFEDPSCEAFLDNVTYTMTGGSMTTGFGTAAGQAYDGRVYASLIVNTAPSAISGGIRKKVAVVPGRTYDFRLWAWYSGAAQKFRMAIYWVDASDVFVQNTFAAQGGFPAGVWTEISGGPTVAPAGAAFAYVAVEPNPSSLGGIGRLWSVGDQLRADAWSDGPFDMRWSRYWTELPDTVMSRWGTVVPTITIHSGAQDIRQARVRIYQNPFNRDIAEAYTRYNLVKNPRTWGDSLDWHQITGGTTDVQASFSFGGGGPTPDPTGQYAYATAANGDTAASSQLRLIVDGIEAGETYRAEWWVSTNVTRAMAQELRWLNASDVQVGGTVQFAGGGFTATSGVWYHKVHDASALIAPATAVKAEIRFTGSSTAWATGNQMRAGRVLFEKIIPNAPYIGFYDGDTPDAQGLDFYWTAQRGDSPTGAQHAPIDPCNWCSEFVISYLPANSTVIMDGITGEAYAYLPGQAAAVSANSIMYGSDGGPMSWPALTCGIPYIMTIDVPDQLTSDVTVAVDLTRREEA